MATLRVLSLAAMLDAFGTVLLGSWTRINGAGMTCPDWPTCHGELLPSLAGGTLWEWTHRLFASLLIPLVIAVVVQAWRKREVPFVFATAGAIMGLFVLQVLLGAATVHLSNSPISVVLHWGTAMALIASLAAMAVFSSAESHASYSFRVFILFASAIIAFLTMCAGAYVSSSGAGLACLSIPECAGNVVVYSQGQLVQMLHRFLAAATLLVSTAAFATVWWRGVSLRTRLMTTLGLALVFVQVLLGLLNVALRLPMDLREAHAANAALVFLAFIVAALFAALDTARHTQLKASPVVHT